MLASQWNRLTFTNDLTSYAIFFCGFDPFGRGRRLYWFENTCRGDGFPLEDGAHTLFLAASEPRSRAEHNLLDELLDYVADGTVSGDLSQWIEQAVASIPDNEKWRLEYVSCRQG
jgi:hypothetical protein